MYEKGADFGKCAVWQKATQHVQASKITLLRAANNPRQVRKMDRMSIKKALEFLGLFIKLIELLI